MENEFEFTKREDFDALIDRLDSLAADIATFKEEALRLGRVQDLLDGALESIGDALFEIKNIVGPERCPKASEALDIIEQRPEIENPFAAFRERLCAAKPQENKSVGIF